MFQSALIRRHASGEKQVDAGTVAETLLFYKHVHIVADRGLLADLLNEIGPDNLVELIENKYVSISYSRSMPAVMTNTENSITQHSFISFEVTNDKDGKRIHKVDEVSQIVESVIGKGQKSRRVLKSLMKSLEFRNIGPQNIEQSSQITQQVLADPAHTARIVRTLLKTLVPNYQGPIDFDFRFFVTSEAKCYILTNLDYFQINKEYHKTVSPSHSSINNAYLLAFLLNANIDVELSAYYTNRPIR
jgi:hypothetical protein